MKIYLGILCLLFSLTIKAENPGQVVWLCANHNRTQYFVELKNSKAFVIGLDDHTNKISYNTIRITDTLTKNSQNSSEEYSGNQASIITLNKSTVLVIKEKSGQPSRHILHSVPDLKYAYAEINDGIWWSAHLDAQAKLKKVFPFSNYTFWNIHLSRRDIDNQYDYYPDFQEIAKKKANEYYDSITLVHIPVANLTNEILNKIDSIDYTEFKSGVDSLLMKHSHFRGYKKAVLVATCKQHTQMFFQLVEDLPGYKNEIFSLLYENKALVKQIKNTKTTSPIKKQFLKYRRREKAAMAAAVTVSSALLIGTVGGIIYLIVR